MATRRRLVVEGRWKGENRILIFQPRNKRGAFALTEDEDAALRWIMEREDLTVSEVLRGLIVGHFLKSEPDGQNLEVRDRLAFLSVHGDEPPI